MGVTQMYILWRLGFSKYTIILYAYYIPGVRHASGTLNLRRGDKTKSRPFFGFNRISHALYLLSLTALLGVHFVCYAREDWPLTCGFRGSTLLSNTLYWRVYRLRLVNVEHSTGLEKKTRKVPRSVTFCGVNEELLEDVPSPLQLASKSPGVSILCDNAIFMETRLDFCNFIPPPASLNAPEKIATSSGQRARR